MMTDYAQEMADELEDVALQLAGLGMFEAEDTAPAAEAVIAEYQRLKMAAEMLEYAPLQPLSDWLIENTEAAAKQNDTFASLQNGGLFFEWAELLAASLRQQDTLLLPELTSSLTHPDWPNELPTAILESLLLSIAQPNGTAASADESDAVNDGSVEARTNEVPVAIEPQTTSQYSILWDPDIHPEILSAFLSDTPDQIAETTSLLQTIAQGNGSKEQHQLAARLTHTIKGACGVVGVTSIAVLTHQLEEILEYSVDSQLPAKTQELLAEAADCLDSMGDAMLNNQPLPPEFEPLLERLDATAKYLKSAEAELDDDEEVVFEAPAPSNKPQDNSEALAKPENKLSAPSESENILLSTQLMAAQMLNEPPTKNAARTSRALSNEPSMRVPISLIDDLLNLAEELVTSTSQINDKVKRVLDQSYELRQQDDRISSNLDELEYSIDQQFRQVRQQTQNNSDFDQLELEVYNELHSVHGLLSETIADNREIERSMQQNIRELSDQLHSQQRINRELNATILDTRMESLETLAPRLERIVRETCRQTDKQADLNIIGSNLAVDTDILKGLTDPLLHLLRNAVDHGIETPEQRLASGKPESGQLELSFRQQGRYVEMTLSDDGKGMTAEAIYERALQLELVSPDQALSETDKLQLILLPGFTTRDVVSDISGRGVGMDVVRDAVSRLRGTLKLESTPNAGSQVHIRLPLTLVAANTLMAKVAGNTVAIPVDSIERLHTLAPGSINSNDGKLTTDINGKDYQVRQLSELLGWGNPAPDRQKAHNVVLIEHLNQSYSLIVDTVLQPREVVVKSLAPWLSSVRGINGACLLSDGAVAAVLDLPRLIQSQQATVAFSREKPKAQENALVLIVDDSMSNRKALSITAKQLGYRTVTAIDGEEALEEIAKAVPDLILSDLEMPRMNGLELAKAVRANTELKRIPFIMVTSRATNKHRKQAQLAGVNDYLVKPVDRDTLQTYIEKWLN
jgi:chemosensory pili system protein ChpA (sensor histidine kinase/response regulator)